MINGNRRLLDGLLLVVIGLIFLLNSLGVIPWGIWASLWRFWPVLLILAGVSVVTHQRIPFLALLVGALVIVIALAWAVPDTINLNFGSVHLFKNHTANSLPVAPEAVGKPLTATLNFGAGDLRIGDTTGLAFDIGVDHTGAAPVISSQSGPNGTTLEAESRLKTGTINIGGRISETWTVAFNPDLPLSVIVNAGACDAKLDMSAYNLTSLNLSSGASSVDITVGSRSQAVDVTVSSAASEVKLHLPSAAGVRLKSQVLSDADFSKAGLSKQGEYWVSTGYDAAAQKINVTISGVVGSIDITR